SNNVNTEDQANLPAGVYALTVTDGNGCSATIQTTITEPNIALSSTYPHVNIDCTHPTGSIDLTVFGGTAGYAYLWSNGNTNQDLSGLIAGIYNVTITDSQGCSTQNAITITQVSNNFQISETHTNILCFGQNTGAINVTPSNGVNPISYSWSSGSQNEDLVNVPAGNYPLNATDANGCTASLTVLLTQPATALTSTLTSTNIDCTHPTGSVNLTPTGGTIPYAFAWSNTSTTEDLSNLTAGTYSVIITDANGCTSTKTTTITANSNNLLLTQTHTNVNCHGQSNGSIDVTVTNGTLPISYSWSNNATVQDLTNLIAGTYTLTATDATGCSSNISVTISEPTALSLTTQVTDITCSGLINGSIDITPIGGTPNYTFLWSNNSTTQDLSNLSIGTYSVTVADAHGCTTLSQGTITQPDPITTTSYVQNLDCEYATGAVDLNVFGGTLPYTFQWSNGLTTQDALGLVPGNYSVTILDANLCSFNQNFTVIQVPGTVSVTAVQTNVTCTGLNNGTIDVTISGGLDPYLITWSNGFPLEDQMDLAPGTYFITAVDAQNCQGELTIVITEPAILSSSIAVTNALCVGANSLIDLSVSGGTPAFTYAWNNGANTQDIVNPTPGNYGVTVTDANGCLSTVSATVNPPLPAITYTETHVNIDCNHPTGSINLTVNGGTLPHSFAWSNSESTEDISNLPAGTYNLTITDANGCTATGTVTISQDPNVLLLSESHVDVSCAGLTNGSIDISTTGGTAPISYLWNTTATSQDLSNLSVGSYSVTATDLYGCTDNIQVSIIQIPAIIPSTVVTNV
ncbi:MAG: SprB repeat-containing protein, partial [Crocinitomicaceae bacterium]|nr:SprB repeat-containing protein [Crocinitomicaceae bacterium]